MVRVKICGITNLTDALCAVREGADAIGFVFAKSPRRVNAQTVRKITQSIGPLVASIGVFVNEPAERMLRIADRCGLSGIQLHGDENAGTIRRLQQQGFHVIKALRMGEGNELEKIHDVSADALLLDASHGGKFGGTGRTFDWMCLKTRKIQIPWIVSGGLSPANVKKLL